LLQDAAVKDPVFSLYFPAIIIACPSH